MVESTLTTDEAQTESQNGLQLTGKHFKQACVLGGIPGLDEDGVLITRLALIYHGENPADDSTVVRFLNGPAWPHMEYIAPVLNQAAESPTSVRNDDGSVSVGDYTIRPLTGNDLMMARTNKYDNWDTMKRVASLTEAEMLAMPYGTMNQLMLSYGFLVAAILSELNT